jgi:hypothetical protein
MVVGPTVISRGVPHAVGRASEQVIDLVGRSMS